MSELNVPINPPAEVGDEYNRWINQGVCCLRCWREGNRPAMLFGAPLADALGPVPEWYANEPPVMVVCQTCGNKRCPKATDHRLGCTGSNEPGQKGSDYEFLMWVHIEQRRLAEAAGWLISGARDEQGRLLGVREDGDEWEVVPSVEELQKCGE